MKRKFNIFIVGTDQMAVSLSSSLVKLGHKIAPVEKSDVCWIAVDTPVNEAGHGIVGPVLDSVRNIKPKLKRGTLVIVSSQIPVGTSGEIIKILGKNCGYAYMPEHMRVGKGESDFMSLREVVVGVDSDKYKKMIQSVFRGKSVVFTSIATAEMIKHALNSFLATSLCFIYDIADVCEAVGADVTDVARALRSDFRIGQEAYLDASAGFSGGHLERDLDYLQKVARVKKVKIPVINAVINKNNKRRKIILDKLGDVKNKKVAFWGVAYKPGVAPENNALPSKVMRDLPQSTQVSISDPWFDNDNSYEAAKGASAIVCITPWEQLKKLDFKKVARLMVEPKIFFDARNYFKDIKMPGIKYIGVGR